MVRYTDLPDNKNKPFGGAYSVYDENTVPHRDYLIQKYAKDTLSHDFEQLKLDYFDGFKHFLGNSHNLIGLDSYTHSCFTQGTTESFTHFYIRYRNKNRLRLARGEYFYHQMIKSMYYPMRFDWLEDDELKQGDVLVISAPFSDTCGLYPNLEQILCECDEKEIPVLLDLAYLNIAIDLEIDLSHPCLEYVVSSLSKVFPVENHRIGIRLQKEIFEDPLYVINEPNYNYINMLSVYLGLKMMQEFGPTYIYNKYVNKQQEYCAKLGLEPSSCVYFGLDHDNRFPEYNRGRDSNRLCFSRIWDGRMKYELTI
jgi:hypothetical protein